MAAADDDNPLQPSHPRRHSKWAAKARQAAAIAEGSARRRSRRRRVARRPDLADTEGATRRAEAPVPQAERHADPEPSTTETGAAEPDTTAPGTAADAPPVETEAMLEADAKEVAEAMRRVDWTQVRAATAGRATDVTQTMRSLADQVDWAKVQPVAAQVSSALIAAVAAGRIPVGGRLGPMVAKAITDQNNLGKRIAVDLAEEPRSRCRRTSGASSRQRRPTPDQPSTRGWAGSRSAERSDLRSARRGSAASSHRPATSTIVPV